MAIQLRLRHAHPACSRRVAQRIVGLNHSPIGTAASCAPDSVRRKALPSSRRIHTSVSNAAAALHRRNARVAGAREYAVLWTGLRRLFEAAWCVPVSLAFHFNVAGLCTRAVGAFLWIDQGAVCTRAVEVTGSRHNLTRSLWALTVSWGAVSGRSGYNWEQYSEQPQNNETLPLHATTASESLGRTNAAPSVELPFLRFAKQTWTSLRPQDTQAPGLPHDASSRRLTSQLLEAQPIIARPTGGTVYSLSRP